MLYVSAHQEVAFRMRRRRWLPQAKRAAGVVIYESGSMEYPVASWVFSATGLQTVVTLLPCSLPSLAL